MNRHLARPRVSLGFAMMALLCGSACGDSSTRPPDADVGDDVSDTGSDLDNPSDTEDTDADDDAERDADVGPDLEDTVDCEGTEPDCGESDVPLDGDAEVGDAGDGADDADVVDPPVLPSACEAEQSWRENPDEDLVDPLWTRRVERDAEGRTVRWLSTYEGYVAEERTAYDGFGRVIEFEKREEEDGTPVSRELRTTTWAGPPPAQARTVSTRFERNGALFGTSESLVNDDGFETQVESFDAEGTLSNRSLYERSPLGDRLEMRREFGADATPSLSSTVTRDEEGRLLTVQFAGTQTTGLRYVYGGDGRVAVVETNFQNGNVFQRREYTWFNDFDFEFVERPSEGQPVTSIVVMTYDDTGEELRIEERLRVGNDTCEYTITERRPLPQIESRRREFGYAFTTPEECVSRWRNGTHVVQVRTERETSIEGWTVLERRSTSPDVWTEETTRAYEDDLLLFTYVVTRDESGAELNAELTESTVIRTVGDFIVRWEADDRGRLLRWEFDRLEDGRLSGRAYTEVIGENTFRLEDVRTRDDAGRMTRVTETRDETAGDEPARRWVVRDTTYRYEGAWEGEICAPPGTSREPETEF